MIPSSMGKDHPFTLYVLEDKGIDPEEVLEIYRDNPAKHFVVRLRGYKPRRRLGFAYIEEVLREWHKSRLHQGLN